MRRLLVMLVACGGGGKPAPSTPVVTQDPCVAAYAEYERRWAAARSEELAELEFDAASVDEVIAIEVALLPTRDDLAKLRGQYTALALFLPDTPWPRALEAADAAIDECGEEAPRP